MNSVGEPGEPAMIGSRVSGCNVSTRFPHAIQGRGRRGVDFVGEEVPSFVGNFPSA